LINWAHHIKSFYSGKILLSYTDREPTLANHAFDRN
jgi:hypothetical protein